MANFSMACDTKILFYTLKYFLSFMFSGGFFAPVTKQLNRMRPSNFHNPYAAAGPTLVCANSVSFFLFLLIFASTKEYIFVNVYNHCFTKAMCVM